MKRRESAPLFSSARRLACALGLVLAGCTARAELPVVDSGIGPVALLEVHPDLLLPSSEIDLVGSGFVGADIAPARLILEGSFTPAGGAAQPIDLAMAAAPVDAAHLRAIADASFFAALGGANGQLVARAKVVFDSPIDQTAHASPSVDVAFDIADTLAPSLSGATGGTLHINDPIALSGDGFLLGTGEGATHALVSGCFLPSGASGDCATAGVTVTDVDVIALPAADWDRSHLVFPFAPEIAGIGPGSFSGSVRIENRLSGGQVVKAPFARPLTVTVERPEVNQVSPTGASLGQYVEVTGGGFVGAASDEITLLHLTGSFSADGAAQPTPVDLELVPHFVSGRHLRYVLDENDALGKVVDLRRVSGTFTGQVSPVVRKGTAQVAGGPTPVTLNIAPVKQVVWVRFLPSYVDSLRLYGLAAADQAVRARVLAVAARDYAGINIEFRSDEPTDFALYSQVDVAGPDPNDLGLLGYDNTPGKDVGNQRLFDKIGGVNASTQSDGFPGFGGIFAEEFLGFSRHPGPVDALPVTAPLFDTLFDPLRPETGTPATVPEAQAGIAALSDGSACPASDPRDRKQVVACATFVLGNLIGTTLTHEVAHSLGLADPDGELFHDPGDLPNRLMEAGDGRPFEERAELVGQGPGVFCDREYDYLRTVLAGSATPPPDVARPGCD